MRILFGFLFVVLVGNTVYAQHNNRSARDLQFRFGNPGARSLGFGGAFLALADDATAPVANPAGMVRTSKRSAAFEINYNRLENEVPFASGDILQTNIFEYDYHFDGGKVPEDTFQVPYVALIMPQGKWRYGFFAQQQANMRRAYENEAIIYCHLNANGYPDCVDLPRPDGFPPSTEFLDIDMVNVGGTAAYSLAERFSIGLTGFYSKLDYQADSIIDTSQIVGNSIVSRFARGDDTAPGGMFGAIWQVTDDLSLGATYKVQPKFTYTATLTQSLPVPRTPPDFSREAFFKIPDAIGFGLSVSPLDQLTINLDANRIYYSQITDDFVDFSQLSTEDSLITQSSSDVTEVHVGIEWVVLSMAKPLSIRLGYWLNPYHAPVNNVEDSQLFEGSLNDPTPRDIFFLRLFEEDEHHYSTGIGYTFNESFQFDAAIDIGTKSQDATVSGIYRF